MATYTFDVDAFLDHMGGPAVVRRKLAHMGVKIVYKTVLKWKERGSLPSRHLANLTAHEALNVGPIDLNRFIVRVDPAPR